ncbi:hypothetical protein VNO77_20157 [Canavalia gladiata]|uniref:Uncharacterized protein n=1 Tax=Canavalia gladiata TaxID=3824 RepID=A0AAN9QM56_CANGL
MYNVKGAIQVNLGGTSRPIKEHVKMNDPVVKIQFKSLGDVWTTLSDKAKRFTLFSFLSTWNGSRGYSYSGPLDETHFCRGNLLIIYLGSMRSKGCSTGSWKAQGYERKNHVTDSCQRPIVSEIMTWK